MNRYAGLAAAVAAVDGVLKEYAERRLSEKKAKKLLGGRIRLRLLHNPGAALGGLSAHPKAVQAVGSGLLCAAAGYFACLLEKEGAALAKTGLGLMLGGGLSNLIDRVRRGHVTDYVSLNFGKRFSRLGRLVFNLSDVCVVIGAVLFAAGRKRC